ncbi:MAG: BamA/TamA family outer membrane protein [Tabrizicola sp.]|nr:BamA/TamA family outer membrane protein [Tabrizicola sp.]
MPAAGKIWVLRTVGLALGILVAMPVSALEKLGFSVAGADERVADAVRRASLVAGLHAQAEDDPQDLIAAARADYGAILSALYSLGHYSAVISIKVDGREAAEISAIDPPGSISQIDVRVDPGPPFRFGTVTVVPLAPGTTLPADFRRGGVARSGLISEALDATVLSWRNNGYAKASLAAEDVVADHATSRLDVELTLNPGPRLRFGALAVEGETRMRERRVRKIAGLPEGEVFSDAELRRAEKRLRRTGIFSSANLVEDEAITAPDLLGITAQVVEQKPRRYSLGVEVASLDGVSITGSWLHRNLLGGGERLGLMGQITNIGAGESGVDYGLELTLDRPATLTPDTTAGLVLGYAHLDEVDSSLDAIEFGLRFSHVFSDNLTGRIGLTYDYLIARDPGGSFSFRNLSVPIGLTWDKRDVANNATKGFYLDLTAKPFAGFGTTGTGLRTTLDGRIYRSIGEPGRLVVAARAQLGAVLGSDLLETPWDDLFFSGGSGTVRGHPYHSLGVEITRDTGPVVQIGGNYFLAGSLELRARVSERFGLVGFVDWGSVGLDSFTGAFSNSHAGAGIGLRYDTGFGPIRADVAAPISGTTGDGVQFYIGLGQSF